MAGCYHSGGEKGYVSSDYVEVYNGGSTDPGTASGAKLSASKPVSGPVPDVRLDGSVDSNFGRHGRWTSSNSPRGLCGLHRAIMAATPQGAMIYAPAPGTATLTFTDGTGATATCTVTVTAAESVRFAYSEENIVASGTTLT